MVSQARNWIIPPKEKFLKDEPYGQDYILSCTYRIGALNPISTAERMHALSAWNKIKNKLKNHLNTTVNRRSEEFISNIEKDKEGVKQFSSRDFIKCLLRGCCTDKNIEHTFWMPSG